MTTPKSPTFKDHFSGHAEDYAAHRPTYPKELFDYLQSLPKEKQLCWDCATGNGQAAVMLATHFQNVVATDASSEQIANTKPKGNITYEVMPSEHSDFESHSVDMITIAQGLHWFDFEKFFKEAERVLKPGGVFAAWSYFHVSEPQDILKCIRTYDEIVLKSWPPEREYVTQLYETIPFPEHWQALDTPLFHMTLEWNLDQLINYLFTWSGTKRHIQSHGPKDFENLCSELKSAWKNPEEKKLFSWPLTLKVFRV